MVWNASTDNSARFTYSVYVYAVDGAGNKSLLYEVYMNGMLDHGGRAILYATRAGTNTFTVIAVDEVGNRSAPASVTIIRQ